MEGQKMLNGGFNEGIAMNLFLRDHPGSVVRKRRNISIRTRNARGRSGFPA